MVPTVVNTSACSEPMVSVAHDCGLFVIVLQLQSVLGITLLPTSSIIVYEVGKITERSHKRVIKAPELEKLPVYYLCSLPDGGDTMVQCDTCKSWYHAGCVHIPKSLKQECKNS